MPDSEANLNTPDLFGAGGAFEIQEEPVLGAQMPVFRDRKRSALELLDDMLAYGDEEHLVFGDRRLSFREHHARIQAWATLLREEYGVQPGDRVAVLGANSPEWLHVFWATMCCGGVAAAFNGWWTAPEIVYALDLVQLDAEAAQLHLVVQAPEALEVAGRGPPHEVARPIECGRLLDAVLGPVAPE